MRLLARFLITSLALAILILALYWLLSALAGFILFMFSIGGIGFHG